MGDGGLGEVEERDQLADAHLPGVLAQHVNELQPDGVAEGLGDRGHADRLVALHPGVRRRLRPARTAEPPTPALTAAPPHHRARAQIDKATRSGRWLITRSRRSTGGPPGRGRVIAADRRPCWAGSSLVSSSSCRSEVQMTRPVAARGGRLLGRGLLTLANVITVAAPLAADWNDSHIFNERWPAHARFHGVTALAMAATLSFVNLSSIWSGASDRPTARFFAAAVPVAYWAPFFLAPMIPCTAVEDSPHPIPRLPRVPTNLLSPAATTATAAAGWFIGRRSNRGESG